MNLLFCTVGRRGYIIDYFKKNLPIGSKVIGTSDRDSCDQEFTSGFYYCDKHFIVASIQKEEQYINDLLNICKDEKVDLLLSFYDFDSYILSKHLDKFKTLGVNPIISSFQVNKISFDKLETYKFLIDNGFKTPWTMSKEEVHHKEIPSYPVIVKPRFGFGSNAINIARNKNEIDFFLNYYADDELIVQQMLSGHEYSFDILNDLNTNPITAVVKRKIKMRAGETDQGYALKDEYLMKTGLRLGKKLRHVGPLDVDFFLVEGEPYILELNPRFGGGYPATHLAGIDFTKLLINMVNNRLDPDYSKYHHYEEGNVAIKDINILKGICKNERNKSG